MHLCSTYRSSVVVKATSGIEIFDYHAGFGRATGIGQPSANERPNIAVVSDAVAGEHEIRVRLRHINAGERCKRCPKIVVAFGVRSAGPEFDNVRLRRWRLRWWCRW